MNAKKSPSLLNTTRIKAIFFDFAGTLYEVHTSIAALWMKAIQDAGMPIPERNILYLSLQLARSALDEQTAQRVYSRQNSEMSGNDWLSYNALILENMGITGEKNLALSNHITNKLVSFEKKYEIIHGVKESLKILKQKYRLGLISNTSNDIRPYLEDDGINNYFEFIGLSYELNLWKPDERIFSVSSQVIGARPQESLFVGDSLLCDSRGAESAGMASILIDSSGKRYPNLVSIKSVHALLNLLGLK